MRTRIEAAQAREQRLELYSRDPHTERISSPLRVMQAYEEAVHPQRLSEHLTTAEDSFPGSRIVMENTSTMPLDGHSASEWERHWSDSSQLRNALEAPYPTGIARQMTMARREVHLRTVSDAEQHGTLERNFFARSVRVREGSRDNIAPPDAEHRRVEMPFIHPGFGQTEEEARARALADFIQAVEYIFNHQTRDRSFFLDNPDPNRRVLFRLSENGGAFSFWITDLDFRPMTDAENRDRVNTPHRVIMRTTIVFNAPLVEPGRTRVGDQL